MNDVIAPEAPPKINFTEFNVREEQGQPRFIRLNDGVVKRLERHLLEGSSRGADRCGFLFGSVEAGANFTIAVEDFEPAASADDMLRDRTADAGARRKVVGFYRTHSKADFSLEAADRALFERSFPHDSRLLLVVKPAVEEVATAMFFLGENGQLLFERATVEFPFNLRELGAEDGSGPAPVSPAARISVPTPLPAPKPAPAEESQPAAAAKAKGGGGVLLKIGVAGVVAIASVFGLSEWRVFDRPAVQPVVDPVSVVEPAPAASVPAEPVPLEPLAAMESDPIPAKARAIGARPAAAPVKPAAPVKKSLAPAATTAPPVSVAENLTPKPAAEPRQPAPMTKAPPSTSLPERAVQSIAAPPEPVERPSVAPPASIPQARPKPAESILPIMPPHAVRQFAPALTEKARRRIVGEVVVRVKASVDAAGKVTAAEPVAGSDAASDALAAAAVSAVKRWQFEPARRGGETVPADVVLSFTFRK